MGKKKREQKWTKETLDLPDDHQWNSSPGYKIFVAGRGAVRFDVPQDWIFEPDTSSFRFFDAPHPSDNCRLEVSYNLLPPGDYKDFPLAKALEQIVDQDKRDVLVKGPVYTLNRQVEKIVWTEFRFLDPNEQREAFSRICIGVGSDVQCLITFDYWVEDASRMIPVWDEVLRSLTLGLFISDPTKGTARPD